MNGQDTTGNANEGAIAPNPGRELSYGEKAVGLAFNPSQDPAVYACKSVFASAIDQMHSARMRSTNPEVIRMCNQAITDAQTAQMWAVKALTWRD